MIELPITNLQIPYLNFATPDIINPVEVNMNNTKIQQKVNEAISVLNTLVQDFSDLDASEVTVVPPIGFNSTNVQDLIAEVLTSLRILINTQVSAVDTKATNALTTAQNAQAVSTQNTGKLNQLSASNGSQLVGATPATGVTGTTVAQQIANLKTQIDAIVSGEVNQNAFSRVNNVSSTNKTDTLNIVAGEGIAITSSQASKTITITNTGGGGGGGTPTMPLPHSSTHDIGGSDEIADLVSARTDIDELYQITTDLGNEVYGFSDLISGKPNSNLSLSFGFTIVNRDFPSYLDVVGINGRSEINSGEAIGIQGVVNPTITNYEDNFLPPFNEWLNYGSYQFVSPYETILDNVPDSWHTLRYEFNCTPNTTYTISSLNSTENAWTYVKKQGSDVAIVSINSVIPSATFTTDADTRVLWIDFVNSAPGTHIFKNPIMTLGSDVTSFVPQHKSSITFSTELYANPNNNAKPDVLFKSSTGYKKLKNWNKVVLDGSLNWEFHSGTASGFKQLRVDGLSPNSVGGSKIVTKYNGDRLSDTTAGITLPDYVYNHPTGSTDNLYISVLNADSGWGDGYTPTSDERKAYFSGWTMAHLDGTVPYSPANVGVHGAKVWIPTLGFNGANGSTTIQFSPSPYAIEAGWSPYNLLFLHQKTLIEDVRFSGHVGLGANNAIYTRSNTQVPFSVISSTPESAFEVGSYTPMDNYVDQIKFDSMYWPLAGRVGDLEGKNYAPLANPTFTGTPRVGSNVIVHAGNASTYSKLANIDNTYSGSLITYTVGSGKQYSTIQACLNALSKFSISPRKIVVDNGHTEPSDIIIDGFSGGTLTIEVALLGSATVSGRVQIGYNILNNCPIDLFGLSVSGSNFFQIVGGGQQITIRGCSKTGTHFTGFHVTGQGIFRFFNCTSSNSSDSAFNLNCPGSFVSMDAPNGTNNGVGIKMTGNIVIRSGGTLSATTAITKFSAAQYFE